MSSETADVCILGGGTVGLLAAHVLAGRGRRVTVLEAGTAHADVLRYSVRQTEGHPHGGRIMARGFGLGGTSQLWGGQLAAWSPSEIAARPHLGLPAWPLDHEDQLRRAYRAVADLLPLTRDQRALLGAASDDSPTHGVVVRRSTWLPWGGRNFARVFTGTKRSHRFHVRVGTLVRGLEEADGLCTGVHYLDEAGAAQTLRANDVVLAAGTLGNAALLSTLPGASPWLGRGFMDHLNAVVGTLEIADRRRFRQHRLFRFAHGARFSIRFQAPPEFAEKRGLPYGLAAIRLDRPNELVALRAALRARQRGAGWSQLAPLLPSLVRGLPSVLATGVWPHLAGREFLARRTVLRLQVSVEQVPSGDSYLAVRDGQVDMHWRPTPGDIDALQQYTKFFVEDVDWAALGLRLTEVVRTLPADGFHMMGGTRMAVRPEDGVVDARGRVFGCPNVRVIGPSVFPTGAVANPTFTACALAWLVAEDMSLPGQGPASDGEFKTPVRTQHPTRTGGPS